MQKYISNKEISKLIISFEKNYDVLKYQYDNYCIWYAIRWHVIRALQHRIDDNSNLTNQRNKLSTIFSILQNLLKILFQKPKDYFIYTYSRFRSEKFGNLSKDIFFDDIIHNSSKNFIKCEEEVGTGLSPYNVNCFINSDFSLLPIHIFCSKMSKKKRNDELNKEIESLFKDISTNFSISQEVLDYDKLKAKIYLFYFSKNLFKKLFKHLKTKKFLFIGQPVYMIAAAKELGIECVEFQHGYIDQYHHGYCSSEYSKKYKDKLPIPDKILLYGDYYDNELRLTKFWDKELYTIGCRKFQKYKSKNSFINEKLKNKILITTQGFDTDNLINFYDNFFKIIDDQFKITIKLHPQYDKKNLKWNQLAQSYDNVFISQKTNTLELINECDIHLSIWSTTHIEAVSMNKFSIVVPLEGYKNMKKLIDENILLLAKDHIHLNKIINDISKKLITTNKISEYFYKKYSEKEINQLLFND